MSTSTPNFAWQLPVPNSPDDANVWGTELNSNLSAQDTQLLAAFTNNIGPTAPVAPVLTAGSTWINNTNAVSYLYYVYDGSQWVQMGTIDPVAHVFIPVGVGVGGMPNVQIFITSGTYTPSVGITYAVIEGVGGGGGGGVTNGFSASGGGSGGYFWTTLGAGSIGSSQAITIGGGGSGASYDGIGGTGGSTSFGSFCTALGGLGGKYGGAYGVGAAIGTGGLINLPGSYGTAPSASGSPGAGGAAPIFGVSTGAPRYNANGNQGLGYGSGGSAGYGAGGTQIGGAGSSGIIRIVEYL
jgi:hypothetical protein